MKKMLILGVFIGILCVISSSAMADFYTMDVPTAAGLDAVSGSGGGDFYTMGYIGYNPGKLLDRIKYSDPIFGATMNYAVGFSGQLFDVDESGFASVNIGVAKNASLLTTLRTLGSFEGFDLPISNDNQQIWDFAIYAKFVGPSALSPVIYTSNFVSLNPDTQKTFVIDFNGTEDFAKLLDIGFIVRFNDATTGNGNNFSDDFHASIVPVPGAILLGLLGMGAAGLKLRRFA